MDGCRTFQRRRTSPLEGMRYRGNCRYRPSSVDRRYPFQHGNARMSLAENTRVDALTRKARHYARSDACRGGCQWTCLWSGRVGR